MPANDYREILRHSSLFQGLPDNCVDAMAALTQRRKYDRGAVLFVRGDPTDGIYGVIAGEIRIVTETDDGQERFLNTMGPGDVFGEVTLIDGGPRTATAIAAAETHIFVIERRPFLDALPNLPELTERILMLLASLVRRNSEMLEDSVFLSVPARLAKFLLNLTAAREEPSVRIAQAELALFLGASRQAINQHLQQWQRDGIVAVSRSRVEIKDRERLAEIVDL